MSYHWDWLFFFRQADDGQLYSEWVLTAWLTTIAMAVGAFVLALLIGTVVGTGRVVSSSIVRLSATIYTEVFRNIPLLVQLFIWYSVLPELVPSTVGVWMKTDMPAWLL